MALVTDVIRRAVGNLQVFAGQQTKRGNNKIILENREGKEVLMVAASNTFKNINKVATVHNIKIICFISTHARKTLSRSEGTTQGDTAALAIPWDP